MANEGSRSDACPSRQSLEREHASLHGSFQPARPQRLVMNTGWGCTPLGSYVRAARGQPRAPLPRGMLLWPHVGRPACHRLAGGTPHGPFKTPTSLTRWRLLNTEGLLQEVHLRMAGSTGEPGGLGRMELGSPILMGSGMRGVPGWRWHRAGLHVDSGCRRGQGGEGGRGRGGAGRQTHGPSSLLPRPLLSHP